MLKGTMQLAYIASAVDLSEFHAFCPGPVAPSCYELLPARGGIHGSDLNDWLQAERELKAETSYHETDL